MVALPTNGSHFLWEVFVLYNCTETNESAARAPRTSNPCEPVADLHTEICGASSPLDPFMSSLPLLLPKKYPRRKSMSKREGNPGSAPVMSISAT